MEKCSKCGGEASGHKCDVCGAESEGRDENHACGAEHSVHKCSGCNEAETNCHC